MVCSVLGLDLEDVSSCLGDDNGVDLLDIESDETLDSGVDVCGSLEVVSIGTVDDDIVLSDGDLLGLSGGELVDLLIIVVEGDGHVVGTGGDLLILQVVLVVVLLLDLDGDVVGVVGGSGGDLLLEIITLERGIVQGTVVEGDDTVHIIGDVECGASVCSGHSVEDVLDILVCE